MSRYRVTRRQVVEQRLEPVFDFFSRAENLEALTPPWLHFRIETPLPIEMRAGTRIDYRLRIRGVPVRWKSEIVVWEPPFRFVDRQLSGPYREWIHEHCFQPVSGATLITDCIRYDHLGGRLAHWWVRRDVESIFDYRARRIEALLGVIEPAA